MLRSALDGGGATSSYLSYACEVGVLERLRGAEAADEAEGTVATAEGGDAVGEGDDGHEGDVGGVGDLESEDDDEAGVEAAVKPAAKRPRLRIESSDEEG